MISKISALRGLHIYERRLTGPDRQYFKFLCSLLRLKQTHKKHSRTLGEDSKNVYQETKEKKEEANGISALKYNLQESSEQFHLQENEPSPTIHCRQQTKPCWSSTYMSFRKSRSGWVGSCRQDLSFSTYNYGARSTVTATVISSMPVALGSCPSMG